MKIWTLLKLDFNQLKSQYKNIFFNIIFLLILVLIFMIISISVNIFIKNKSDSDKIILVMDKKDYSSIKIMNNFFQKYKYLNKFVKIEKISLKQDSGEVESSFIKNLLKLYVKNSYDILIESKKNTLNIYIPDKNVNNIFVKQLIDLINIYIINQTSFTYIDKKFNSKRFIVKKVKINIKTNFRIISFIISIFLSFFLTLRLSAFYSYYITTYQKINNQLMIILCLPLKSSTIIKEKILLLFIFNFINSFMILSFFIAIFNILAYLLFKIFFLSSFTILILVFLLIVYSLTLSFLQLFLGYISDSKKDAKINLFYIPMFIGLILSIKFGIDIANITNINSGISFLNFIPIVNSYEIIKPFLYNSFLNNLVTIKSFANWFLLVKEIIIVVLINTVFIIILYCFTIKLFKSEKILYFK